MKSKFEETNACQLILAAVAKQVIILVDSCCAVRAQQKILSYMASMASRCAQSSMTTNAGDSAAVRDSAFSNIDVLMQ